ncbi:MAG: MarR family transcriptional regulator [Candidatus Omnitrophota bacterium]
MMPGTSISDFADRISEILPIMMREFLKKQVSEVYRGKLTLPQFLVIDFLDKQGQTKMKDIAAFMNVTMATTTGIVERLVREEYVERLFDPRDRRIIKIKLTGKGCSLIKKIQQNRREMIIKVFGKISEKDRENYLRILRQVRDIVLQERRPEVA